MWVRWFLSPIAWWINFHLLSIGRIRHMLFGCCEKVGFVGSWRLPNFSCIVIICVTNQLVVAFYFIFLQPTLCCHNGNKIKWKLHMFSTTPIRLRLHLFSCYLHNVVMDIWLQFQQHIMKMDRLNLSILFYNCRGNWPC